MEVQELRVGNYIKLNGEYKEVLWFKYNKICVMNEYPSAILDIDRIEPIELTEEILLKCGFEKQGFYFLNTHSALMQIEISLSRKCFVSSLLAIEIKHLHQLQNLYFALTNNELEINL